MLTQLTKQLVACPSITPDDKGCQTILSKHLANLGFEIEHFRFEEVNNLWARKGKKEPLFVFLGHTDVVPPGPLDQWDSPPFDPQIRNNQLYGRGSADMKASLAAMLVACQRFIANYPLHQGSIAWLITSDEEGPATHGTIKVIEALKKKGINFNYCLVGEPGCEKILGDTIKIGRRGSLSAHLIIQGKQGHIAYPERAKNPIILFQPILTDLLNTHWDDKVDAIFQPTSLQLSNIHAGTGAENVIPNALEVKFNFRYSTETTAKKLQSKVVHILKKHHINYQLSWKHGGIPFLSTKGPLREACLSAIKKNTGLFPQLSTAGGTSDARFIAPLGVEVVEFGPCNQSIHQINESVSLADLEKLAVIYEDILNNLLL